MHPLSLAHTVDAREIKARLELPIVRHLLANGTELLDVFIAGLGEPSTLNVHFFDAFADDEKRRCVRVAIECAFFWQLRLYGIFVSVICRDVSTFQTHKLTDNVTYSWEKTPEKSNL